jgi:hypothetical protein
MMKFFNREMKRQCLLLIKPIENANLRLKREVYLPSY